MVLQNITLLHSVVKMPLMALPVCTPVVHLKNGSHILISPGSQLHRDTLRALPNVTDIVAPNLFHLAGVPKAASIFNQARIWGVLGASEKRKDIKWSHQLFKDNWPYQDELAAFAIDGMPKVNEVLFIHRESKSLIITDLAFNLHNMKGFGAWLILHLFGTYNRFAISRFFLSAVKDQQAFRKSIERVLAEPFDNIIVSHGDHIYGQGRDALKLASHFF